MAFVFLSKGKDPPKRKPPRGIGTTAVTQRQAELLAARAEKAFSFSWKSGITRLRARVDYDKLQAGFRKGSLKAMERAIPFAELPKLFDQALLQLKKSASVGVRQGLKGLPDPDALRFDLANPAIRKYIATTQGRLIEGVTEEFQTGVQQLIQTRFGQGMTTQDMAARIKPMLKESIGLDSRSTGALANFRAAGNSEADAQAYADRLYDQRARRIARTEVATARNEGQALVWDAAADQGLIDRAQARKVWTVDPNACPYCEAMDGISVGMDEMFLGSLGEEIANPPLHVNCRCSLQLQLSEES